ncbi:MAG TPA: DUF1206 domain-containing protein [Acidimicrobiales bacterium]|nr:DUF1206 domain-containing protein [Acidimicrobiales bacterium]
MGGKKERLQDIAEGTAGETAGRVGLAARGAMYCVVGVLAIRLVTGADERADREGALDALARQRVGSVLLAVLAIGFAGYAVWRFLRAFTGAREGSSASSSKGAGVLRRLLDVAKGAIYLGLVFTTLRVLFGGRDEVGGAEQERDWTLALLQRSWGRPLVLVVGIAVLIGGLAFAARGFHKDFEKSLDSGRVPSWARRLLPVAGTVGYVARGGVVALVGWFIAHAAWTFDAKKAVGVAGALGRLAGELYGRVALSAVAFGLLSFGVFSFVEAAYRKVLED